MKVHRIVFALAAFLVTLSAPFASADPPPGDDPFAQFLFPPEVIMKFQREIGLDEKQRTAIKESIQKAQSKFLDFQFDMQSEQEKLQKLLSSQKVDETAVLSQVDKVLTLEREVKKTQITLLVRIKNLLNETQQAKLTELRKEMAH